MLTVKAIHTSGNEWLLEAHEVTRTFPQTDEANNDPPPDTVWVHRTNGDIHPITEGQVYVMNEAGKTVASYSLRTSPAVLKAA